MGDPMTGRRVNVTGEDDVLSNCDLLSDGSAMEYDSGSEAPDSDEECKELKLRCNILQPVIIPKEDTRGPGANGDIFSAGVPGTTFKLTTDDVAEDTELLVK